MGLSSIGIGSGLSDVPGTIAKLVELEKIPLEGLKTKNTLIQARISTYAQIKSLSTTLADAVSKLTRDSGWNGVKVNSSNSAVAISVTGIAHTGVLDVGVSQLSRGQTSASGMLEADARLGRGGTLKVEQGGKTFEIEYTGSDTLTTLAQKINEEVPGISTTVLRDASGKERLMMRSKDTGDKASFSLDWGNDGPPDPNLAFVQTQNAQNARITVNGVVQESSSDIFTDVLPGLKISVNQQTTSDARVSLTPDKEAMKKNIQDFVDAYNALNTLLSDTTGYDKDTKVAGVLQADGSTVSLQNALRGLTGGTALNATGDLQRLAQIGIQMQKGGALKITDVTKLDKALDNSPDALKSMFAAPSSPDGSGGGIAVGFKKFTDQLLAFEGSLNNKTDSLEKQEKANLKDQDKVNKRAEVIEKRLRAQYTALDRQMVQISKLAAYMDQQTAAWNKNTG